MNPIFLSVSATERASLVGFERCVKLLYVLLPISSATRLSLAGRDEGVPWSFSLWPFSIAVADAATLLAVAAGSG